MVEIIFVCVFPVGLRLHCIDLFLHELCDVGGKDVVCFSCSSCILFLFFFFFPFVVLLLRRCHCCHRHSACIHTRRLTYLLLPSTATVYHPQLLSQSTCNLRVLYADSIVSLFCFFRRGLQHNRHFQPHDIFLILMDPFLKVYCFRVLIVNIFLSKDSTKRMCFSWLVICSS